jgi:methionine-rich copper-binding protein CopC
VTPPSMMIAATPGPPPGTAAALPAASLRAHRWLYRCCPLRCCSCRRRLQPTRLLSVPTIPSGTGDLHRWPDAFLALNETAACCGGLQVWACAGWRMTEQIMRSLKFLPLSAALLWMFASTAGAHAHLESANPQDQSHVTALPKIELGFSEAVQLTGLTLQRGNEPARVVENLPAASSVVFAIPVEVTEPGDYVVTWTVASDDGHSTTGRIRVLVMAGHDHGKAP